MSTTPGAGVGQVLPRRPDRRAPRRALHGGDRRPQTGAPEQEVTTIADAVVTGSFQRNRLWWAPARGTCGCPSGPDGIRGRCAASACSGRAGAATTFRRMGDTPWTGDACSLVDAFRRGERSPVEELEAVFTAIDASP